MSRGLRICELEGEQLEAACQRAGGWVVGLGKGSTIEREGIALALLPTNKMLRHQSERALPERWWCATLCDVVQPPLRRVRVTVTAYGPTPDLAAKRAFAAAKLGNTWQP